MTFCDGRLITLHVHGSANDDLENIVLNNGQPLELNQANAFASCSLWHQPLW